MASATASTAIARSRSTTWSLRKLMTYYWRRIRHRTSARCLAIASGSTDLGKQPILYDCNNLTDQQWDLDRFL